MITSSYLGDQNFFNVSFSALLVSFLMLGWYTRKGKAAFFHQSKDGILQIQHSIILCVFSWSAIVLVCLTSPPLHYDGLPAINRAQCALKMRKQMPEKRTSGDSQHSSITTVRLWVEVTYQAKQAKKHMNAKIAAQTIRLPTRSEHDCWFATVSASSVPPSDGVCCGEARPPLERLRIIAWSMVNDCFFRVLLSFRRSTEKWLYLLMLALFRCWSVLWCQSNFAAVLFCDAHRKCKRPESRAGSLCGSLFSGENSSINDPRTKKYDRASSLLRNSCSRTF